MSALSIQVPFPVFNDRDGQPLDNGYVWIGVPNLPPQTNPVNVYFDEALTILAPQPLRTINGYISRAGSPAQVYIDGVNFSILVQDSKGSMVYNFPEGTGISPNASGVSFIGFKGQVGNVQNLADDDGSDWIGFEPAGVDAVPRSSQDKMLDTVSLKDFGAVGDYTTDDTNALIAFLSYLDTSKKSGYIPSGVYRITESIDLPGGVKLFGNGSPGINTWFDTPDKANLRPGYKDQISGSVLIFDGAATKTYTTNRTDKFASFTYALSYLHVEPCLIENIGILQDMDVYTASGVLTTRANVNAADYDCGLVLRSQLSVLNKLNIFGYWPNGSFIVNSQQTLENIDSDYTRAIECIFTTVSLVGDETGANGLTGFMGTNCGYYSAADFHTRAEGDYTIPSIFVDGFVTGIALGGIRGHRFHGNLRTYSNEAVQLGYCDDVVFELTTETPPLTGVPNANVPGFFQGQPYTGDVRIIALASANTVNMQQNNFANVIGGSLITIGGQNDERITASYDGAAVSLGVDTATRDAFIKLDSNVVTGTDWTIRNDVSNNNALAIRKNNAAYLTINQYGVTSGAIANDSGSTTSNPVVISSGVARCDLNHGWYVIDTEGAAASDDLDSILAPQVLSTESALITFKSLTAGQYVTVAGLTYTSTGATSAEFIAYAFANIEDGATPPANLPYGTFTGTLTGYDASRASNGSADITFTSTTPGTNVGDISTATDGTALTVVITQGGADITPTYEIGQQMFLRTTTNNKDVVFKNATGNIRCNGAADFTLDFTSDHASCVFDGTNWRCTKFTG
jgi:Pectate lyase superfamily protein